MNVGCHGVNRECEVSVLWFLDSEANLLISSFLAAVSWADSRICIFKVRRRKLYPQSCPFTVGQGQGNGCHCLGGVREQRQRCTGPAEQRRWLSRQECPLCRQEDLVQVSSTHMKAGMDGCAFLWPQHQARAEWITGACWPASVASVQRETLSRWNKAETDSSVT